MAEKGQKLWECCPVCDAPRNAHGYLLHIAEEWWGFECGTELTFADDGFFYDCFAHGGEFARELAENNLPHPSPVLERN